MNGTSPDVCIIGAGIVGAFIAHACAAAGLRVAVVDRGGVASGTTSAGEGNILVSDKQPGPELDLVLLSARLWRGIADDLDPGTLEYEPKGGVVVARTDVAAAQLRGLTANQRAADVDAVDIAPSDLADLEPNLTSDVAGGAFYAQDAQVQPTLAAARLLQVARVNGAKVHLGVTVTGFAKDAHGAIIGVRTDAPTLPVIHARHVVNAAGTWAGEIAALAGAPVTVLPRRGFILVTEPLPRVVRHKVYTAEYVSTVANSNAGLETSVVVEGTRAGTVLIGASRERVGFDRTVSLPVIRRLAAQAIDLFPFLRDVALMRAYLGFRPYCPDHLPVIGADPRAPGLIHAAGHEGAGIGLASATGRLVAQLIRGETPDLDLTPFRPDRFAAGVVA